MIEFCPYNSICVERLHTLESLEKLEKTCVKCYKIYLKQLFTGFSAKDLFEVIHKSILLNSLAKTSVVRSEINLNCYYWAIPQDLLPLSSFWLQALNWIESCLKDRDQFVQIADVLSNKLKFTTGVPQGSTLGLVLFLIYVNGVDQSICTENIVQYTDPLC